MPVIAMQKVQIELLWLFKYVVSGQGHCSFTESNRNINLRAGFGTNDSSHFNYEKICVW